MLKTVELECSCGAIKGQLDVVPKSFFHVHCLCCDCQNFAAYLGHPEKILDQYGGSELFQTYPAFVKITEGHKNIGCVQLHRKGLYRWYSTCCNMPLANTMTRAAVPFVGVSVKFMRFASEQEKLKTLGPVTLKAFGQYAIGTMPADAYAKFSLAFMPKIIGFMLRGLLTKKHTPSPFFNNKQPVVAAKVLPDV